MKKRGVRSLYCTYCSARKNEGRAPMPALRRYVSPRIRAVHRVSRLAGVSFAILSGEFGLLGPYEKIPYYDHLLRKDEVAALLPRVTSYLERKGIRSVRFFHEPPESNPRLKPYIDAITRACRVARVRLILSELTPPSVVSLTLRHNNSVTPAKAGIQKSAHIRPGSRLSPG